LVTISSIAQNAIQVKTLTTDDGLNFRHVNTITQDVNGFMWLGTRQGITKYDGHIFKVFNNSRNNPNSIPYEDINKFIYQSSKNRLWYIANHKLFALDLKTETLQSIKGLEDVLNGEVLDIALDHDDNLWIVNDYPNANQQKAQQLIKYDGKVFRVIKSLERKSAGLTSLSITQDNAICWATVNHGLTLFDQNGKILNQKIIETYDYFGHTIHFARSFFDSKNQHYYFSETKGGVDIHQNLEFRERLIQDEAVIHQAVEDKTNGIWYIGKKTLFYLNPNEELVDYTAQIKESLKSSNVTCAFVDQSNLLWLGTDNGILKVKLQPRSFEKILHLKDQEWGLSFRSIFALQNGDIIAMCETKNQLYRISKNSPPQAVSLPNYYELLKDALYFVVEPEKDIAYTVTNDLIEIDFNSNELKLYNQISPYLNETKPNPIIRLRDGSLVAGFTLSNLIHIDSKTKSFSRILKAIPEEDFILKTLIQSQQAPDILWVGTESKGLFKINLDGEILEHYHTGSKPSLSNNSVLSLLEFNNQLVIGTFGGGISRLDFNTNKIQIIDKRIGLSDNNVVSILPVENNVIIAATYNGLSRINLDGLTIQNYFEKDGISDNEFNYTSAFKSDDGEFYFGGLNGITKFSVESLPSKKELPGLNFTQLEFYNQPKDTVFQFNKLTGSPIVLSPYDLNLKVAWSIPDYFDKKDYRYYTKLEGFEEQWLYQSNRNNIIFNKLPAGEYNLKVKAADKNGNLSQSMLEIPITISQVFYKSWWFITLSIIAVGLIIYVFFQYRLQQALAIERLRTQISSELHDDVGSMLTGLAMQTEMLEMQAKTQSEKKKLKRLTQLSRNTIAHMRDFVWSIDSRKDRLEDLIERMQEYAEEYLLPAGIHFDVKIEGLQRTKKINLNCRRNLFLIFKEATTNVLKHSNAKNVKVHIINRKGYCRFYIKDDGNVKPNKKYTGQGLANMKMRSEHMNAELAFDTSEGFKIELCLPQNI
jgi:ligand-binding sensor domain-containing protein/two-component sensor histidine kinase